MKTSTDFANYISVFLSDYLPYHRNVSPNTIFKKDKERSGSSEPNLFNF